MKARLFVWGRALSEKLIKFRITAERECNVQSTGNQIPNKHPSYKEIKCVDACAIDAKIEQTTLNLTAKYAANY